MKKELIKQEQEIRLDTIIWQLFELRELETTHSNNYNDVMEDLKQILREI